MDIVDGNIEGKIRAREAVLIDVFRATTSMVVMMYRGAEEIIPFENERMAREFLSVHRDYISAGEKDGIKIGDFDYGNSPVEFMSLDLRGKRVAFVSTNGTRVLKKIESERVLIGSFLNADSIVRIVDDDAVLVCANRQNLYSIEDFLCASYIKARKKGIYVDFDRIRKIILRSGSAQRMRSLGAEDDMHFSLSLNMIPIVPVYRNGKIREIL
ncbi:MAG: 2-phosphosulfolactate phosphatase [Thermoplasmata archaeon]